jgi:hypothetical protein
MMPDVVPLLFCFLLVVAAGPHCQGMQLLDAIDSNMRKEYTLEGVYQWMTHHIIPMAVLAELVVHSYPYKADIHMTLLVSAAYGVVA